MTEEWPIGAPMFGGMGVEVQKGPISRLVSLLLGDVVLIVITGLVLFGLMVYWARFLRNKKRNVKEPVAKRVYRDPDPPEETSDSEREIRESRKRYKYRWKRRTHRGRNPTLAETGGLPEAPRSGEEAESP